MKKQMASFLLASTLAGSLCAPAYAANHATVISAKTLMPDVSVTVSGTKNVYVNPFKIPVTIGTENESGQVISLPEFIENESNVPVSVSVTVSGEIKEGSDMALSSSSTDGQGTAKRAFLYFEMKAVGPDDDVNSVQWDGTYDEDIDIVVRTSPKLKKNMITLAAASDENGRVMPGGVGVFHLAGDAVENPRYEWTASDGVDVTIAFTFTPVSRFSS